MQTRYKWAQNELQEEKRVLSGRLPIFNHRIRQIGEIKAKDHP